MVMGMVRLSLDFECGWGVVGQEKWRACEAAGIYRNLRPALRRFIKRLDELEMSFTWAVVGAMIEPPKERDITHLKGKFATDVATFLAEAEDRTSDGRDLLEMVLTMHTKQEFGTHTYSHLLFSDVDQSEIVVGEDLVRAACANSRYGLEFKRIVFPRNHPGHYKTVRAAGIEKARMYSRNTPHPVKRPGRLARASSALLRPTDCVVEEEDESGLILHYASEFLNWGSAASFFKRLVTRRRIDRALRFAACGGDVHFWLHPFNLAESQELSDSVDDFLLNVARLRDKGLVETAGF